jgi:hypothetical protein
VSHQHPQRDRILRFLPNLHPGLPLGFGHVIVFVTPEDFELGQLGEVRGDKGWVVEGEYVAIDELEGCELRGGVMTEPRWISAGARGGMTRF